MRGARGRAAGASGALLAALALAACTPAAEPEDTGTTSPLPSPTVIARATPAETTTTAPSPTLTTTPAPPVPSEPPVPAEVTVSFHDGVLEGTLPEDFVYDDFEDRYTDGTSYIGCWAWRDPSITAHGVQPEDIAFEWLNWWASYGYYTADEIALFTNEQGYADSEIWFSVFVYETAGGDYDFEIWEPRAWLVTGDAFIECSMRVYAPTDHPGVFWDAAFKPLVESIEIVDPAALLPNVWGTDRGDD